MPAKTGRTRTSIVCVAAVVIGSALAAGGCRTAMRGAGYKRLITSYAEAVKLSDLTEQALEVERAEGASAERLAKIEDLHEEVTALRDRWHDALDRRQRQGWNRTKMNWCWREYTSLYPDERALRSDYWWQRRVSIDELRSRRTPLTHDLRFKRAPAPKDGVPYREGSWMVMPGEDAQGGRRPTMPAPSDAPPASQPERTPEPVQIEIEPVEPRPAAEPYLEPSDDPTPTEELLIELLEEQAEQPRGDG